MAGRPTKQQKLDEAAPPANVIIQFQSPEGDATGAAERLQRGLGCCLPASTQCIVGCPG